MLLALGFRSLNHSRKSDVVADYSFKLVIKGQQMVKRFCRPEDRFTKSLFSAVLGVWSK